MLGLRIATLRRQAGISQKSLAKALHVSPSTIGMYEQERRVPSTDCLVQMARLFGVSTDFLLTGQSKPCDAVRMQQILQSTMQSLGGSLRIQSHDGTVRALEPREFAMLLSILLSG